MTAQVFMLIRLCQIRDLEEEVRAAEARLMASEDTILCKNEEIHNLHCALDLKAQDLSAYEGNDIHSRLLYAVAKVRAAQELSLAVIVVGEYFMPYQLVQ